MTQAGGTAWLEGLNAQYFQGRLSPAVLGLLGVLEHERAEVQAFVERMFALMRVARIDGTDFPLLLAFVTGHLIPKVLPGAWGGRVPPITLESRHVRLDDYLAVNPWAPCGPRTTLVDLGCGFPPLTTIDTARRYPDWRVIGADPSFGRYLVHDEQGDYACFDDAGALLYYQVPVLDVARWDALNRDPVATRTRFTDLMARLRAALPSGVRDEFVAVEKDGAWLVVNPLRQFELPNLEFRVGGIGTLDIRGADVLRCLNVLIYFDRAFRDRALSWAAGVLAPGGLFLCGMDWLRSTVARYTVYRQESGALVPQEFAFSIDNVRPLEIVPWFTIHEDDYETRTMAHLVGILRADEPFRREFDARLDRLLAELNICPRGPDGYLGGVADGLTPQELEGGLASIGERLDNEGFTERAAAVLRGAGCDAWRNCVGHVAIGSRSLPWR